jgi:transcriptional regulator with XRE-family HTH domain
MPKMPESHVVKRRATALDTDIGLKVRAKRLDKGLSQTGLGELLGVTFQQVQKYEKGVNRISAGRLQRIAEVLDVPVTWFMGVTGKRADPGFDFLQSKTAIRLNKAFSKITSRSVRYAVVIMLEALAPK